jgi:MYXO-CTERM domain-containing protein
VNFQKSANPGQAGDWWSSLAIAPSNPNRVYVTGYRLDGQNPKVFLLYTSTTGGASFTAMTMTGITTVSPNSTIEVVGISPTNDQTVFVKVTFENGSSGDSIYRSTNAGQSWTKILSKSSNFGLSLLVRKNGTATQCIAGTREMGAWVANDCLTATTTTGWTALTNAPHIGCLYADSANNVWACTQNYESPQLSLPSDGYGIMKTTDLTTWTGVLKYQDIQAPVACAAGTVQEDECVQRYMDQQSVWCCLVPQLGITSTQIDCTGALACFGDTVDGAPDAGTTTKPPGTDPSGCCGTGNGKSSVLLSLVVAAGLLFRRRRPS